MHFIKHIIEFEKLYLIWQHQSDSSRTRYVVGELIREGEKTLFSYLPDSDDYKKARELGFEQYPAFTTAKHLHSEGVLDAFMSRLPPNTRGDFNEYLKILRLPPDLKISDFALLGYSGAKLPGDNFQIIPSFEHVVGPCEFLLDVAGYRHLLKENLIMPVDQIELYSKVHFVKEPNNKIDPGAIGVFLAEKKLGYVTRVHLPFFHSWLDRGYEIKAVIERKNGYPSDPVLYLFIEVIPPK